MEHFIITGSVILNDMFRLAIPVAEKVLRPAVVYAFLVVLLRIFGKRELAQLNPFDLVVLLSLSNTVQNAIIGDDNSVTGGLIGAFTLLGVNYLVVRDIVPGFDMRNLRAVDLQIPRGSRRDFPERSSHMAA